MMETRSNFITASLILTAVFLLYLAVDKHFLEEADEEEQPSPALAMIPDFYSFHGIKPSSSGNLQLIEILD